MISVSEEETVVMTESETQAAAMLASAANADIDEPEAEADETADDETEEEPSETVVYDESYTVAELRAAAKAAGITGYSSMTKAELLEALNGS